MLLKYVLHQNAVGTTKKNEMSVGGDNQGDLSLGRVRCEDLEGYKGNSNKQNSPDYAAAQTNYADITMQPIDRNI